MVHSQPIAIDHQHRHIRHAGKRREIMYSTLMARSGPIATKCPDPRSPWTPGPRRDPWGRGTLWLWAKCHRNGWQDARRRLPLRLRHLNACSEVMFSQNSSEASKPIAVSRP